jgi:ISXO2-like transposase domain
MANILDRGFAMAEFARSLVEFQHRFPDEEAWRHIWPTRAGRTASAAGSAGRQGLETGDQGLHLRVRLLRQADLGHRGHHHARLEAAADGFWAAYLMATHSNGISALQLRNQLGLGSYKSAWLLCANFAAPWSRRGRSPLAGLAEVDETEIPLRTKDDPVAGGGGRSHQGKMLVAGAVEVANGAPGRIRLAQIPDFSATSLHGFIVANVAPGTTIRTDGWSGYPGAPDVAHDPHVIGPMAAHVVLPWIHHVFSNLKTWALGRRLPRSAQEAPAGLSRRVRFPLQSSSHPPRRFPLPPRHRRRPQPHHPQHADRTGSNGIRLWS